MGRPGPGPARGQHSALSQSASADTSGVTVTTYRQRPLTRGELCENSEPATTIPRPRNGVSKLNRADCFCDTESNKKAKSVFKIRPRSELQQNTMYVSPGPAPGYQPPVRGPLHPYQGFRPVQTGAASWSGYQVCVSCLTSCCHLQSKTRFLSAPAPSRPDMIKVWPRPWPNKACLTKHSTLSSQTETCHLWDANVDKSFIYGLKLVSDPSNPFLRSEHNCCWYFCVARIAASLRSFDFTIADDCVWENVCLRLFRETIHHPRIVPNPINATRDI